MVQKMRFLFFCFCFFFLILGGMLAIPAIERKKQEQSICKTPDVKIEYDKQWKFKNLLFGSYAIRPGSSLSGVRAIFREFGEGDIRTIANNGPTLSYFLDGNLFTFYFSEEERLTGFYLRGYY